MIKLKGKKDRKYKHTAPKIKTHILNYFPLKWIFILLNILIAISC